MLGMVSDAGRLCWRVFSSCSAGAVGKLSCLRLLESWAQEANLTFGAAVRSAAVVAIQVTGLASQS